jgi:hypothetical protein
MALSASFPCSPQQRSQDLQPASEVSRPRRARSLEVVCYVLPPNDSVLEHVLTAPAAVPARAPEGQRGQGALAPAVEASHVVVVCELALDGGHDVIQRTEDRNVAGQLVEAVEPAAPHVHHGHVVLDLAQRG